VRAPKMMQALQLRDISQGNSPHCQVERVSGRRRPGHGGDLGGSADEQDTQHCQTKDGRCGAGACGGQTDEAGHVVSVLVVTPVSLLGACGCDLVSRGPRVGVTVNWVFVSW
jgi:hypothetical protein